jgi:hypothetical protein
MGAENEIGESEDGRALCFYVLRFTFKAVDSIVFPPWKAADTLRSGLGPAFRRIDCHPSCVDPKTCKFGQTCSYARIFRPKAVSVGPSGLADRPRPFVIRARHLNGCAIPPGDCFHVNIHLFLTDEDAVQCFVSAVAELAHSGIGASHRHAVLSDVAVSDLNGAIVSNLYEHHEFAHNKLQRPECLRLQVDPAAVDRIRIEFLTLTELKHEGVIVREPQFNVLFARLRDRISALRSFYGSGLVDVDFQSSATRSKFIRLVRWDGHHLNVERRTARKTYPIGGFVGIAEYEGELSEFLPYLEIGRWTGVGRQTVWGKGEFMIEQIQ